MTQEQFKALKPQDLVESRAGTVIFLGVVNNKVLLCWQSGSPIPESYSIDVFIKEFVIPREIYTQYIPKGNQKGWYLSINGIVRKGSCELEHASKYCNSFRTQKHAEHYKTIVTSPEYAEYIRERMQDMIDRESDE
jgi:hypothetical protein